MLPQSGVTSAAPPRSTLGGTGQVLPSRVPIDIRRFPWINRLAADYAFDFARVADFFPGNAADPKTWADAIVRAQQYAHREAVAEALLDQQRRRDAPAESLAATPLLRDPRTVAIVTGQQAGVFGGPLFTLLKALTAIRLAEEAGREHQVPTVAIFWVDAEDHDWDEVKRCCVLDRDSQPTAVTLADPTGANEQPISRLALDSGVATVLDDLQRSLISTEFTESLFRDLAEIYAPGVGMATAFARWIERLLGPRGLIVYDSSDPAMKRLASAVFEREVESAGRTTELAVAAGAALERRGYHAQVTPQPGSLALFHLNDRRDPVRVQGDGFVIGDRHAARASLLEQVRSTPEHFSPSVLLRPLVQDTLFPTVCYVAGPSELAYLAQLRDVYAAFKIPMPLIYQRASATLVDSNAMRFLTRHDFPFEALRAQDEGALNELLASQLPPTVEASLQDAARAIEERMITLAKEVPQIDPTLEGTARSTLSRMQDDLKKLHGKIIQAAKRRDETLRRQYHHARAQAFPGGQPQERELAMVYFLNKYGPSLVERLAEELPLEMGYHWLITV